MSMYNCQCCSELIHTSELDDDGVCYKCKENYLENLMEPITKEERFG